MDLKYAICRPWEKRGAEKRYCHASEISGGRRSPTGGWGAASWSGWLILIWTWSLLNGPCVDRRRPTCVKRSSKGSQSPSHTHTHTPLSSYRILQKLNQKLSGEMLQQHLKYENSKHVSNMKNHIKPKYDVIGASFILFMC